MAQPLWKRLKSANRERSEDRAMDVFDRERLQQCCAAPLRHKAIRARGMPRSYCGSHGNNVRKMSRKMSREMTRKKGRVSGKM
jgi:hypothetical protein